VNETLAPPDKPPPRFGLYAPLLFLALIVAMVDLGGRSLHDMDVPRGGALAREMIDGGHWLVPRLAGEIYANKPPLFLWLVAGPSLAFGGVTPFSTRLPAALAFVALVLAAAWWARRRTGSVVAARTAGLLTLSTFLLAWLGREGRLDMLAAALSVWGAARLDVAAHGPSRARNAVTTGLILGAALLTKGPLVLLVGAAVLLVGGRPESRLRERLRHARLGRTLLVALLVAAAWLVPAGLQGGSGYLRTLLLDQAATRVSGAGNHLHGPGHYFLMLPLWGLPWGPGLLLVMLASLLPRTARALGPTAGLARAALLLLVIYSSVPTKHVRYLAPVAPLALVALAWWFVHTLLPRLRPRPRTCRAIGWILPLAAVGLVALGATRPVPSWAPIVPALGLVLTGLWCVRARGRPTTPEAALLLIAVFAISAGTVLRTRSRVPRHVRFNDALARLIDGDGRRVWTVEPLHPEDVFRGAPHAHPFGRPERAGTTRLAPDAVIVCRVDELPALEAARGASARVLLREEQVDHPRVVARFATP